MKSRLNILMIASECVPYARTGGLADVVNTVSPTYAIETRTSEYAHGLALYLNDKGDRYRGILNVADYEHWNPETE